ncbi:unnamed protein product [Effrenium voratum]|nr:unnamed protein product [Effrenium voratum]
MGPLGPSFSGLWAPIGQSVPPGHTDYSWHHADAGSKGFSTLWAASGTEVPPGHTAYSWEKAMAATQAKPKEKPKEKKPEKPKEVKAKAEAKAPAPKAAPQANGSSSPSDGQAALAKIDLRCGRILECSKVQDADSLYLLKINVGEEQPRQVVSSLVKHYKEEELKNRQVVVYCNIKPGKMRGLESQAMVLAATKNKGAEDEVCELLDPPAGCKEGSRPVVGDLEIGSASEGVSVKNISKMEKMELEKDNEKQQMVPEKIEIKKKGSKPGHQEKEEIGSVLFVKNLSLQSQPVFFGNFSSLAGESDVGTATAGARTISIPESEKYECKPLTPFERIQSSLSAPARFVYFKENEKRKRFILHKSEYREKTFQQSNTCSSSYIQHHDFQPLVQWSKQGSDSHWSRPGYAGATDSVKLSSGDFTDDLMVVQEYAGFCRHFMIFPSSPAKLIWDVTGAALIVYDLFTISMQVFDPPDTPLTTFMQWLILVYWTMNMCVSCLVGYIDKGIFVMVPHKVMFHYLKTWFVIDLVVVGTDWVFSLSENGGSAESSVKLLRSLRLFRMVRLVRILRLRKTMESVSDLVDSEYISIIVSIFKMLALLLIVNHVIACFWFWIGDTAQGWVVAHHLAGEQWEYQYTTSLHWAITQFTPASMHVQPQNIDERAFAISVVVFALVGFSYVVGSISGSLAQLRGMTENRARQFWELRRHLRKNKVSITLSARIQKYVEHVMESQEENVPAKDVKLLALLSEQLQSELECEICMPHFSVHPLFARLCVVSRVTIHRLANNAIVNKQLARTDTLFIPGETATHMYIVVYGRLVYSRMDSRGDEHKELVDKGEDWISEPVLWTPSWVHLGLLMSMTERVNSWCSTPPSSAGL